MTRRRSHAIHDDLIALTDRLIAQYSGALPAGAVMRCVSRTYQELRIAGVRDDVLSRTEQVARTQLAARLPAHGAA